MFGSGNASLQTNPFKPTRSFADVECFSQRCLDTVCPDGYKAYLQLMQMSTWSDLHNRRPTLSKRRSTSSSDSLSQMTGNSDSGIDRKAKKSVEQADNVTTARAPRVFVRHLIKWQSNFAMWAMRRVVCEHYMFRETCRMDAASCESPRIRMCDAFSPETRPQM